ncbi:mannose-1-phosphate guanylyltransferase/mannose-6-phosphate isomerase [Acidovorax sp. GBBC 3334]|uniref:mannose-1-phosphate guanylyltransferase/mannose-6-phosphate isomerase n=1 Tax=Acidovorax sp. GBBC 3334 TaxID=2940496 RepID=UPI0023024AF4|nr:mannose-1-phosphate guanylyltransferase/mannose-6-phosphate isomerase [Acidovorax sp. GBBC 3334]MDA8454069.1 mannose-1-phosphate guanylyltransferase/mannose-6-phosphate isomerase [Acidovorax sp. GBBC 3334]
MNDQLLPVILCGGSGTRLWPLSRETYPKQFLPLAGQHTMLQQTASRLRGLPSSIPVDLSTVVVCNREHRFLAASQLLAAGVDRARILLEPSGRNTAPALTLAALQAQADGNDPVMLVMPADHVMADLPAFHEAVSCAFPHACAGAMITFGIVASRAETGYGYIQRGEPHGPGIDSIASFAEKPDAERAQRYIDDGNYLWNSGLFMVRASIWLKAIRTCRPDIAAACATAMAQAQKDLDFVRPDGAAFEACPADSIDYAVMERLPAMPELGVPACVVPLAVGWSDLGAWDAVWEISPHDSSGNAVVGDAVAHDCEGSLLFSSSRLVAGVGLEHIVVIETPDAVLVADKRQTQDVKQIVAMLRQNGHALAQNHRKMHRPWGWYDAIDSGDRFQVKRIVVNPGASLSLQKHHHRAEHWVVVKGTAEVTKGEEVFLLGENESTFIPLGHVHRLSNPGKVPLEIIEVQSGSYLGEDDIVRLQDTYGR